MVTNFQRRRISNYPLSHAVFLLVPNNQRIYTFSLWKSPNFSHNLSTLYFLAILLHYKQMDPSRERTGPNFQRLGNKKPISSI